MTSKVKYAFEVDGIDYPSDDGLLDGRQVRSRSGHDPAADYRLIKIGDRTTTSIGLEEPVDLTHERPVFRAFEGDRDYDFTVDDRGWEWGAPAIGEADVRAIGKIAADREIVLEMKGKPELVVPSGGVIDLSDPGVERIYSRKVSPPKKLRVTFVIGGEPTEVEGKPQDQLVKLLEKALKQSENTGQPVEQWQVTDEPGNALDVTKTLAELGIVDGAILLASLKAGAAG